MARYFIDIFDGALDIRDATGADFASYDQASTEARRAVRDMIRDYVGGGGSRSLGVSVRNRDGKTVYALRLALSESVYQDD